MQIKRIIIGRNYYSLFFKNEDKILYVIFSKEKNKMEARSINAPVFHLRLRARNRTDRESEWWERDGDGVGVWRSAPSSVCRG